MDNKKTNKDENIKRIMFSENGIKNDVKKGYELHTLRGLIEKNKNDQSK